jgi:hypothetical protein
MTLEEGMLSKACSARKITPKPVAGIKDKRTKFHERQRYHVLILATQGYHYPEISRILLLTEETLRSGPPL